MGSIRGIGGLLLIGLLGLVLAGCPSQHCQSGAKYGTQCYSPGAGGDPPATDRDPDSAQPPPGNDPPPTTPR